MDDILSEAQGIAQCKDCPWYKSCVAPMRFTAEDVRRQLEQTALGVNPTQPADPGMQNMLANMAQAAQNSVVEGCPVFIDRLRTNPDLAKHIKQLMQDWGKQEGK